MRAFLSSTLAACLAMLLVAPATANAGAATRLQIEHTTSAIWQADPSIEGTGPLYDAVTVYVQLRNCPTGFYYLHMDFIQDGVSYDLASRALGVGELNCNGGRVTDTLMGFLGNGLHPGPAVVTAYVTRWADGTVLAQSSRTVRIPAGYHQP